MKISIENIFISNWYNSGHCCFCRRNHWQIISAFCATLFLMGPASAQIWEYVAKSDGGTEYYLDKNSIRPQGKMLLYSQLSNYASGIEYNNRLIHSLVVSRLSDCVNNKFRTVGAVGYSEHSAKGNLILASSTLESDWIIINMDKITGHIQSEVCKQQ